MFSSRLSLLWRGINMGNLGSMSFSSKAAVGKGVPAEVASMQKLYLYSELSKSRLSGLVVLTTGAGFVCAGPSSFDLSHMVVACTGTGLCAASASTLNQIFEKDRDIRMKRTKRRPLPAGSMNIYEAMALGSITGIAGTGMLITLPGGDAAWLGLLNIGLYSGLYTFSKPRSEINTWIGSLVGSIPPVMGWVAAGGNIFDDQALSLASLLFLWQFPHFFSLAWLHREDYSKGGFKMVPTDDPQGIRTASFIVEYSAYLSIFPLITTCAGLTTPMFLIEASMVNAYLVSLAKKFKEERTNANARRVFLCSLWYLPLVLGAYVFHSKEWTSGPGLDKGISSDSVFILEAKNKLKGICLHEVAVANSEKRER